MHEPEGVGSNSEESRSSGVLTFAMLNRARGVLRKASSRPTITGPGALAAGTSSKSGR